MSEYEADLTGRAAKRPGQVRRLRSHVPIRFDAAVIERVKKLADDDGVTVSTWIRRLVAREIDHRRTPVALSWHGPVEISPTGGYRPAPVTVASSFD